MTGLPSSTQHFASSALLQRLAPHTLGIFRALQLGDMLCMVPALRALRAALPKTHITLIGLPWAEQFASRFSAYIDAFVAFPGHPELPEQPVRAEGLDGFYDTLRRRQLELVVQMHGSGQISNGIVRSFGAKAVAGFCVDDDSALERTHFLTYPASGPEPVRLLALAEYLGAPARGRHLEFPITEQDEQELRDSGLVARLEQGRYLCIHPGARIRNKCWSPQCFAQVADQLAQEFRIAVVLTGSEKERDLTAAVAEQMRTPVIDAASPISIGAMAALMNGARLLICNDTGVSHIAAGLRLPSVVIFSKADIQRWSPLDQQRHRCLWDPQGKRVDEVLAHARELLQGDFRALCK